MSAQPHDADRIVELETRLATMTRAYAALESHFAVSWRYAIALSLLVHFRHQRTGRSTER
jgi:hypothetical protein